MHKSTIRTTTFVLLASSLVMLAAMPLFNQNNFSNVKAQEYDGSYDYVDEIYSQYPTEINKYECRTGPLEGFFVSSVEFCKNVKFDKDDDRKDDRDNNKTGTQGPPGPQGPEGPQGDTGATGPQGPPGQQGIQGRQGIQGATGADGIDGVNGTNGLPGPPGITQLISGTNVYLVTNTTSSLMGDNLIAAQAMCQPGDFVINGGYNVAGTFTALTIVNQDRAITNPAGNGWEVIVLQPAQTTNQLTLDVNAYCFDNSP